MLLCCIISDQLGALVIENCGVPAPTERVSMQSAEYHRKMAAEYNRLANSATTEQERREYLRLEQEELLMAYSEPFIWNV